MNLSRSILASALTAAALALGACATEPGQKSQSAGAYVDDATVTAKVKTAIASDVGVRAASNVNVETYNGVVQLSGFADNNQQASMAEKAARNVKGVQSVKNDIRIRSGS
jgi:osmotically-inducible protein OsmY